MTAFLVTHTGGSSFQVVAAGWSSPSCCKHLGNEPGEGRALCIQINKQSFKKPNGSSKSSPPDLESFTISAMPQIQTLLQHEFIPLQVKRYHHILYSFPGGQKGQKMCPLSCEVSVYLEVPSPPAILS